METRQKPRPPRQRIKGLFKRTPQSPSTASTKPSTAVPRPPSTESQTAQSALSSATTRSPGTAPQTPQSTSSTSLAPAHGPTTEVYGDRERTRERYKEASNLLQDAVKRHEKWGAFDFPELTGEPEGFNDSQFKDKINAVMQS
jgi:hypothetical protein